MFSFIISIPAFILLALMIFSALDVTGKKDRLFDLDNFLVQKVFVWSIAVEFIIWVLALMLPLGFLLSLAHLVVNCIAVYWFARNLFSGNVTLWFNMLKAKLSK